MSIKRKNILSLSNTEAHAYFLQEESYFSADFPLYFSFKPLLDLLDTKLGTTEIESYYDAIKKPNKTECVNHRILASKDGLYGWRPLELIHPALYVALVNKITSKDNWRYIKGRIAKISKNKNIICTSWPVLKGKYIRSRANQINEWIDSVENKSITYSLDYEYVFRTDILDCYGSIYTHSIAWALHSKKKAKINIGNKKLIGNYIDNMIQNMSFGQTNGIPQGSTLMDFLAEIVLTYTDFLLSKKISDIDPSQYKIIRYRDDYRIFVNNPQIAERIIKELSEELSEVGLKINPSKTESSNDVVISAFKKDKLQSVILQTNKYRDFIKELLEISIFSREHRNSSSLMGWLKRYYDNYLFELITASNKQRLVMVSLIVDIAFRSPKVYPTAFAILSLLVNDYPYLKKKIIHSKILKKFKKLPNTGFMELWLQRLTVNTPIMEIFTEKLCQKVVSKDNPAIWESSWLSVNLRKLVDHYDVVNRETLKGLNGVIQSEEVDTFNVNEYDR